MHEACGSVCRMMELLVMQECLYVCALFVMAVLLLLFCGGVSWGHVLFSFLCFFFSTMLMRMSTCCTECVKGDAAPVE